MMKLKCNRDDLEIINFYNEDKSQTIDWSRMKQQWKTLIPSCWIKLFYLLGKKKKKTHSQETLTNKKEKRISKMQLLVFQEMW